MAGLDLVADPVRRDILDMLRHGPLKAGEINAAFDISAPAISRHLKLLREAGFVTVEKRGAQRIYTLDRRGFDEVEVWLARHRAFWEDRLDDLEARVARQNAKNEKRGKRK